MIKEQKIKVLVVEDSRVVQMLLVQIINSDSYCEVIGTAANGLEALRFLEEQTPDVILMDIEMPEMDGFETTRRIMEKRPVPIVICTASANPREAAVTFRLLEAGAVACIEKPVGREHPNFKEAVTELLETIKLMSEVKVVRRWSQLRRDSGTNGNGISGSLKTSRGIPEFKVVGIGASTGGPPVLQTILSHLPKDFPLPLLVVQHIAPGFLPGLAEWLNQTTSFKTQIAAYGLSPLPGHVYLAPDDFHMTLSLTGQIVLSRENPQSGLRPSVDSLFRSLAEVLGARAIGVLLTGMGKDGAIELKNMKNQGAMTIAQDQETSVIYGMPGQAVALEAATYILPPDKIASALVSLVMKQSVYKEQEGART